jgi:hypothetical protein
MYPWICTEYVRGTCRRSDVQLDNDQQHQAAGGKFCGAQGRPESKRKCPVLLRTYVEVPGIFPGSSPWTPSPDMHAYEYSYVGPVHLLRTPSYRVRIVHTSRHV